MLAWRGKGWLVPIGTFASLLITQKVVNTAYNDPDFYTANAWPKIGGAAIAGAVLWVVGRKLNAEPGRRLMDTTTKEEFELKRRHDFMHIPMQYWGPLVVVVVAAIALMQSK